MTGDSPEEGGIFLVQAPADFEVALQVVNCLMMERHVALFSALLLEAKLSPAPRLKIIVLVETGDPRDSGKRVRQDADDGLVAFILTGTGGKALDELRGLLGGEDGRGALTWIVLRAADWLCRIRGQDVSGVEVTEEPPDGREVLFNGGLIELAFQLLDIREDVYQGNSFQREPLHTCPLEDAGHGPPVSAPGVLVAKLRDEELDGAFLSVRTRLIDQEG